MKREHRFLERLSVDGWDNPMAALPIVELAGDSRVLVENHHGIIQYSQEQIGVRVKYGKLMIFGCRLHLACMTRERLVISGKIDGIKVERRECP